ncbi:hypothetical protein K466DRAFT_592644 [Polyporus arcularius HHB13444]|uniref:GST N-terminal domain-containing protein n=1 Tax=Polyporus arcularius HHB13444 TaxID=1314778 RepID=A0A5C3NQR6_9APHY|nr:hypothetical protein K466DRAFT_592644 [Polyporus arcularius HHB13444]
MPATKRLTFYNAVDSPFPHRVRLALEEAGAKYDVILIDLYNKPDWYGKKVYPVAKVPVLVYGGPALNEDDAPSPEAATISESLVILEFLADLFPILLPADPVLRARARFFIKTADEKFSKAFFKFVLAGGSMDDMLDAVMEMQALLPNTGFAVGKWSIADAAFVPFLLRLESLLKNKFWAFAEGVAEKTLTELHAPKFAKIRSYLEDNVARESMTRTWDEMAALAQIDRRTRRASAQNSTLSSSQPSVSVPQQWKDLV